MLNINPEIVYNIILKIREFQAKEEVSFPEDMPDELYGEDILQVLADHEDDLSYQELHMLLEDLEPDQLYDLVALSLLGNDEYEEEEWEEALEAAHDVELEHIPDYMLATPYMADYLKEGLAKLDIDVE